MKVHSVRTGLDVPHSRRRRRTRGSEMLSQPNDGERQSTSRLDGLPDEQLEHTLLWLATLRRSRAIHVKKLSYQARLALNLRNVGLATITDVELFHGVRCWRVEPRFRKAGTRHE